MQHVQPRAHLPAADYARLQSLLRTMIGARTAIASLIRGKLGAADIRSSFRPGGNAALGGRRVTFRVDRLATEERVLTWQSPRAGDTVFLSLLTARGMALLGLRPGQSVFYRTESGRTEFVQLERVSTEAQGPEARPAFRRLAPETSDAALPVASRATFRPPAGLSRVSGLRPPSIQSGAPMAPAMGTYPVMLEPRT
jgi:hypothetical protein